MNKKAPPTLRKGDVITLTVKSIAVGGDGVSKDLNVPVFIAYAAPGDQLEVELFDVRKDFARAKIVKILAPAAVRTKPPCGLFGVCGGCQMQQLTYGEQLVVKQSFLQQACQRIGGIDESLVAPTIAADNDLHYRNKVQFPVRNPHNSDRLLAGYYKTDSHELVNIKHCPVQPELIDKIMELAKALFEEQCFRAYDEKTRDGLLRHINARYSFSDQKALLTFVLNITNEEFFSRRSKTLKHKLQMLAKDLMAEIPEVVGVSVNFNCAHGNRILGNEFLNIGGAEYIEERLASTRNNSPQRLLDGVRYRLSPGSFFQVNSQQAIKLFDLVRDAISDNGNKRPKLVVDAYAGVGAMALWAADTADQLIAIEEHDGAIEDGQYNATLNDVSNIKFKHCSTEEGLADLISQGLTPDVVLVDPPRKGLSAETVTRLLQLGAERIVYVSCNPATLARDLKLLEAGGAVEEGTGPEQQDAMQKNAILGYKTKQIQPIDLFPHTHHIESVTILERQGHGSINLEEARQ